MLRILEQVPEGPQDESESHVVESMSALRADILRSIRTVFSFDSYKGRS